GERIADVRRQRDVAASLAASASRPVDADAWRAAAADIARSPLYHGLELKPQFALTPWRKNPETGLWEFVHLLSGPPPDDAAGTYGVCVLVLRPGGTCLMGADPASDPSAESTEQPRHEVTLAPFFLASCELTIAQWVALGGQRRTEVIARPQTEPQQL